MGYRSDVAIKIYGDRAQVQKVKDYADAEFAKHTEEQQKYISELIDESEDSTERSLWDFDEEDDSCFFLYVEHVKWYDGYPTVDYFNAIFNHARDISESESNLSGEYVRIGEEMDDIEEDRFNVEDYYQVSVCRSIEY